MARIARLVVPGIPHHITQRGNRRERTFFGDADYRLYHVHAVVTPKEEEGCGALSAICTGAPPVTSMRVTARPGISGRHGSARWRWMRSIAAIRYVSLNPVCARLVERAEDWPWSSVRAHLSGRDGGVVTVAAVLERVGRFAEFVDQPFDEGAGFAPRASCGDVRTADRVAGPAEAP
jgi:putative transposase